MKKHPPETLDDMIAFVQFAGGRQKSKEAEAFYVKLWQFLSELKDLRQASIGVVPEGNLLIHQIDRAPAKWDLCLLSTGRLGILMNFNIATQAYSGMLVDGGSWEMKREKFKVLANCWNIIMFTKRKVDGKPHD